MSRAPSPQQIRETFREADQAKPTTELDRLLAMEAKIDAIRPDRLAAMKSRFQAAFALADTRRELLGLFTTDMLKRLRDLENSALGFRTDRPNEKHRERYDDQTLTECACEAIMRGLRLYGNEFNIISGRVYVTSEGLARLLSESDGLTNLLFNFGLPRGQEKGAVVPVEATWTYKGVASGFKTEIAVRLNAGMGAEGAIGKAQRKARYRVLTTIQGSSWVPPDGEVDTEPVAGHGRPEVDSAKGLSKLIKGLETSAPGAAAPTPSGATTRAPATADAGSSEPGHGDGGNRAPVPKPSTDLPRLEGPSADDRFVDDIFETMDRGRGPNASTVDITVS